MFNRYTTNIVHESPERIDVHRAPTDESVKLLREMEAAARDSVVRAFSFGNAFSAGVVEMQHSQLTDEVAVYVSFELNGERYESTIDRIDAARLRAGAVELDALARLVIEKVAAGITDQLTSKLVGAFREVSR